MLIRFELDTQAKAFCLAWALGNLRDKCRDLERPFPFEEQLRQAEHVLQGGHMRTPDEADRNTGRDELPPFLTRRDFAARVGRSERQIRRWIAAGKIRATVAGIPSEELERLKGRAA